MRSSGTEFTSGEGAERCGVCGCPRREWLSVREVAVTLGLSERGVRRLCWLGELPAARVGGQWRIHHRTLHRNLGLTPEL